MALNAYKDEQQYFMQYHALQIKTTLNNDLDQLDEAFKNGQITQTEYSSRANELRNRANEDRIEMIAQRSLN